jgi:hypothetical protein
MSTTTQQTNESMMVSGIKCNNCLRIQPPMLEEVFLNPNYKCKCQEEETDLIYDIEQFKDQCELFLHNSKYCNIYQYDYDEKTVYTTWTGHKNKDFKDFLNLMTEWENKKYVRLAIKKSDNWAFNITFNI